VAVGPAEDGFLSRFLEKRGEGLHHITFKTDDIEAAIEHVRSLGYELVDVNLEGEQWKEAFFRPSGAHGTLVQIGWSAHSDDVARHHLRPSNLEELLSA
jgi:catechol 2,3-dioxygenase-like lactoylglutathione lyase family enzyme